MSDAESSKTFCIICTQEIPPERAARRSNTCSKDHAKLLAKRRREAVNARRCRHCARPSTPEERKLFNQWRREKFGKRGRGRPARTSEVSTG